MSELEQRRLLRETNQSAILQGWENLGLEGDVSGFIYKIPLLLSAKQAELAYETFYVSEEDQTANDDGKVFFRLVRLSIEGLSKLDVSHREFNFFLQSPNSSIVIVSSSSFTAPGHESRGYGSGLIMLSDKVIEDAIDRFPDLNDKSLVAIITAASVGNGQHEDGSPVLRYGWTSNYAERLGYIYSNGFYYKIYREHESAPINISSVDNS